MLESASAATDLDLISYCKAIPDARMRRSLRLPAWYLLLVGVFGIFSRCQSLRDLERFATRHHTCSKWLCALSFIGRLPIQPSASSPITWMWRFPALESAHGPTPSFQVAQLLCDGKTLRCSIEPTARGGSAFISQVTLYR